MTTSMQQKNVVIDVSGDWVCRLDPEDAGIRERWFDRALEGGQTIRLPGTVGEHGLGNPLDMEPVLDRETVRSLRQHHRYVGAAWFQRELAIPPEWIDKQIELFLERVMFESRVWVDGREAGVRDSLSTPHVYEIGRLLRPGGRHLLTVRVDNRDVRHIGPHPSAYTDETQTIWNGVIGKIELRAQDPVRFRSIQVYPDVAENKVRIRASVENGTGKPADIAVRLFVRPEQAADAASAEAAERPPEEHRFTLSEAERQTLEWDYEMGRTCRLWDEFTPSLYVLEASLRTLSDGEPMSDERSVVFGMRSFGVRGTQFIVNGRPTFLRGTLDCCIYPLTGYPPMDEAAWENVFRTVKDYGLNHVRFHSWCPPEAAFCAADRLGVYLQVEGPVWMDIWNGPVGSDPEHYVYLPQEAERIVDEYGNHPSFCLFSNGNELNGDFGLLHDIVDKLKKKDGRRLYTLTTNWDRPLDEADDFFIAQTVDGVGVRGQYFPDLLAETTALAYTEAVSRRPVPVVSHEVGQYAVYPDMREIDKYRGTLRPINFEAIRRDLERKDMLGDADKFTRGSGMLALQLYRDEVEAALRTPGMGGFQLLDLHDFPGQSTATVGILNSFWESKGLIGPAEFRRFCGPTVLLLEMPKRLYDAGERWEADVLVSHYGPADLDGVDIEWSIARADGSVLDRGVLAGVRVPAGTVTRCGGAASDAFRSLAAAEQLRVTVRIVGTDMVNAWDVWVYPPVESGEQKEEAIAGSPSSANAASGEDGILVAEAWSPEVERHLARGGRVLLLPFGRNLANARPGKFFPVFWSPVHFKTENPCGIYVRHAHPLFEGFPTDDYASYQWKDLLEQSVSLNYDSIGAGLEPLVQVIPNFYHNHRWTNLFECRAGRGKLVVCSIDVSRRLEERGPARQLRRSILEYMALDAFNPATELSFEQLRELLREDEEAIAKADRPVGRELAIGRPATASSVKSAEYAAGKGNDGIGHTMWLAADEQPGHWWQVDLGKTYELTGTIVKFPQEANYLYVIQVSEDGQDWRVAVNQTGQTDTSQVRVDLFSERGRYVKIVYNGLPNGISAGHMKLEVYGK